MVAATYLDASALVKLLVSERETDALRRFVAQHPRRYTNLIATVEVRRAAARRGVVPPVEEAFDGVELIALDARLAAAAGRIEPATLRSLDAIHLVSAQLVADEINAFVSYDHRLAVAAREAGLPVETPA